VVLKALDSDYALIGDIKDAYNIRWVRRYYAVGEFSITFPSDTYSASMKYIYSPDRRETGIIQQVRYGEKVGSKYVTVSGYFLERKLDNKIVQPTYHGSGNIETLAREMITDYQDDLGITLGTAAGLGTSITFQETGDELGKRLYDLLATQELSFSLDYDFAEDEIVFNVWQGLDRTQDQTTNNWVCFSQGMKNISKVEYTYDDSNYKNYAVVGGHGEGDDRTWVYVDLSATGEEKRKVYIDAKDLEQEGTDAKYKAALAQRGADKLLEYQKIVNVTFTALDTTFRYLTDYDLGDKVDIVLDNIGSFSARIEEIEEVWKNNTQSISLSIGALMPTLYKKVTAGKIKSAAPNYKTITDTSSTTAVIPTAVNRARYVYTQPLTSFTITNFPAGSGWDFTVEFTAAAGITGSWPTTKWNGDSAPTLTAGDRYCLIFSDRISSYGQTTP